MITVVFLFCFYQFLYFLLFHTNLPLGDIKTWLTNSTLLNWAPVTLIYGVLLLLKWQYIPCSVFNPALRWNRRDSMIMLFFNLFFFWGVFWWIGGMWRWQKELHAYLQQKKQGAGTAMTRWIRKKSFFHFSISVYHISSFNNVISSSSGSQNVDKNKWVEHGYPVYVFCLFSNLPSFPPSCCCFRCSDLLINQSMERKFCVQLME